MTGQLDGYESDTLFNSMQEGGQGVFSLMVDLKNIVDFGEPKNLDLAVAPAKTAVTAREVLVGQELRLELNERSVSPVAGEIKVVWSNGFEGSTYHVRPEDIGTTLTATATFAGADMRPLEVTIQCGPVVMAPAPTVDRSLITLTGASDGTQSAELMPATGIREFDPACLYVDARAFTPPVDRIDVEWIVGGEEMLTTTDIEAHVLTSALDIARLTSAHEPAQARDISAETPMEEIPNLLAELLGGTLLPGLGGASTAAQSGAAAAASAAQAIMEAVKNAQETSGVDEPLFISLDDSNEGNTSDEGNGNGNASENEDESADSAHGEELIPADEATELTAQNAAAQNAAAQSAENDEASGLGGESPEATGSVQGLEHELVDVTEPFFAAQFTPPQGSAGTSLTVQITGHAEGAEPSVVRLNAGWIGQGVAFELKPDVAVRVADPRVGETAWAKVKRRDFVPAAERFTYQWLINGRDVEGETDSHIDVTPSMRGRELSVLIEAIGANAMTSTLEASLGIVGLGDAPEYLGEDLEITGKPRVGKTLSVANLEHEFILPEADSIEIQWMRGKELIPGERGLNHVVGLRDVDEKIWARVTLRKLGHSSTVLKTPKVRVR